MEKCVYEQETKAQAPRKAGERKCFTKIVNKDES